MAQIAGENSVPLGIPLLRVRLSEDERELLYASTWEGNDDRDRSHGYGELYEMWQVQRFVALAYAK